MGLSMAFCMPCAEHADCSTQPEPCDKYRVFRGRDAYHASIDPGEPARNQPVVSVKASTVRNPRCGGGSQDRPHDLRSADLCSIDESGETALREIGERELKG